MKRSILVMTACLADPIRENHSAIIRELQRMQDDLGYVSAWEPKTVLAKAAEDVSVPGMRCW